MKKMLISILCLIYCILPNIKQSPVYEINPDIYNYIVDIANEENVTIYYISPEKMQELTIGHNNRIGFYYNNTIFIDNRYNQNYEVLAHEMGHYFGAKTNNDHSEETAQKIGGQIIFGAKIELNLI
jgi:hypothetical protein